MDQIEKAGQADEEVLVSAEMVAAGLSEMAEHSFGDDLGYVLECVFRQMLYAGKLSASTSKLERDSNASFAIVSGD